MERLRAKVIEWMATYETGASSEAMAFAAMGLRFDTSHPQDIGDLFRCIELVDAVPEIRDCFAVIANLSPQWREIVRRWDELVQCYREEDTADPSSKRVIKQYRRTYAMLRVVLAESASERAGA